VPGVAKEPTRTREEHPRGQVRGEGTIDERIRSVIRTHGRLPVDVDALADNADLFQAGMTSHASVNVMLALEDAFDVEFPDRMLTRSVFESVASIRAALTELDRRDAA
jgi:acyl carrier protein